MRTPYVDGQACAEYGRSQGEGKENDRGIHCLSRKLWKYEQGMRLSARPERWMEQRMEGSTGLEKQCN